MITVSDKPTDLIVVRVDGDSAECPVDFATVVVDANLPRMIRRALIHLRKLANVLQVTELVMSCGNVGFHVLSSQKAGLEDMLVNRFGTQDGDWVCIGNGHPSGFVPVRIPSSSVNMHVTITGQVYFSGCLNGSRPVFFTRDIHFSMLKVGVSEGKGGSR